MKVWILFAFVIMLIPSASFAAAGGTVPRVLAYQSLLYDDGGNPIPDGEADVIFRIVSQDGDVLYDEYQSLEVVRGGVSALVGNGRTAEGAPAGGIPFDILGTGEGRYLEVEAKGYPPTDAMEIASVPYAIYADKAFAVSEGAVDAEAIANGSVAFEDLSEDLIDKLSKQMTGGKEIVFKDELDSMYRGPSAASNIGVERSFRYSGANDLQGVLGDMDLAIKRREERIVAEGDARIEQGQTLQSNIDGEAAARQLADGSLQTSINGETAARQNADSSLQTQIGNEAAARQNADSSLQTQIGNEAAARQNANNNLQSQVNTKVSKSGDAIDGNLEVTGAVDGVDVSEHNHSGDGQGGFLYPQAIWFDAGTRADGEVVDIGEGFGQSNCRIATAFSRMSDDKIVGGVDILCTGHEWNGEGQFAVRCRVSGGDEAGKCGDLWANPSLGLECIASYMVICAKGMGG